MQTIPHSPSLPGLLFLFFTLAHASLIAGETFTPYPSAKSVPRNVPDLWKDYDPRAEPLDIQVVKEWKEEGVTTRYVTFRVGTFKGSEARIAAYYSFPDNGRKNAAFVWSHGGGQRAERSRGLFFARKGYATVDINWLGRPMEDDIEINTDWGKVDPTQGPRFYSKALRPNWKLHLQPDEHSLDPVSSPRNSNWFLLAVAGRRAITFLEQQPEVDPNRMGFSGFSMGGMVTALTAIDPRLKAVVPMVGGTGFKDEDFPGGIVGSSVREQLKDPALYRATVDASAYWPWVKCPVLFLSSSNDFHSTFERIYRSMNLLPHDNWRVSCNLHQNHGPGPEQWVLLDLWFEQHLKGIQNSIPSTPPSTLERFEGKARFSVTPTHPERLQDVEIYASHDPNSRTRFWKRLQADQAGPTWTTTLPLHGELPLYVFALCRYRLQKTIPVQYGETDTFTLNSQEQVWLPESVRLELLANLKQSSPVFEDFQNGLQDWASRDGRTLRTYKFQNPELDRSKDKELVITLDPMDRNLVLQLRAESQFLSRENNLGSFSYSSPVKGPGRVQVRIRPEDFKGPEGRSLEWDKIAAFELTLLNVSTRAKLQLTQPDELQVLKKIELVQP